MVLDVAEIRATLNGLMVKGIEFFDCIPDLGHVSIHSSFDHYSDRYWEHLDDVQQETSIELQSNLLNSVKTISKCITDSTLLTEADRRDLSYWAKSLRSALRLRKYDAWDTEILHDEGTVLGIKPSGQSDVEPMPKDKAQHVFKRGITYLLHMVDLIDTEPRQRIDKWILNPQATVQYEPNSAFVMMQIDASKPELEDLYNAYKESFERFGITAVRADEIEHQEVITEKITEKIRCSEFLLADLTAARPSVYYETGYAHALGRKVIMYRSHRTKLHFDLAGYNCPEYKNNSELRKMIIRRLEQMTNRKPN